MKKTHLYIWMLSVCPIFSAGGEIAVPSTRTQDVAGKPAMDCVSDDKIYPAGAEKIFTFDVPSRLPLIYGGESRAENAVAGEYCIYLDIEYTDGTWKYAERMYFLPGTHDWQGVNGIFLPEKPVKRVILTMLLRGNARGKAFFRRPFVTRPARPGEFGVTVRSDRPFSPCNVREGFRFDGTTAKRFSEKIPAALPVRNPLAADECVVWTAPSTQTITPLDFPDTSDRMIRTVKLDLARGERESFQVNISAGAAAGRNGVTLEIGPFAAADGTRLRGAVKWERVGYLKRENGYQTHPDAPPPFIRWLPDPLLPPAPMRIRADGTQGAWVTAHAAHGAKSGVYKGTVRVVAEGQTLSEIPVELLVRDFALPRHFGMRTSFSVMDGFTRAAYPQRFERMKRRTWDLMLDHRLNPDDISRTEPPVLEDLIYARSRGMSLFNILNIVPAPEKTRKWVCYASPEATDNAAFHTAFMNRVRPYHAALKKHGLDTCAYIYGFDERGKEYYPGIRRFWEKWRAEFPSVPLMTTAMMYRDMVRGGCVTNAPDHLITDWHCPLTPSYRADFAERLRATTGMKTWWYVCCEPCYPFANISSYEYPAREGRVLGWQTWTFRSDGLLYWHVNYWPDGIKLDPSDTFFPDWPTANRLRMPGDGIMLYPGPDDVYPSIRLASVRDGVEDYERLEAAAARLGRAVVKDAAARVSPSVTEFDRTGAVLLEVRAALADRMDRVRITPGNASP